MFKTKITTLAILMGISVNLCFIQMAIADTTKKESSSQKSSNAKLKTSTLEKGNWDQFNYDQLNRLIVEKGKLSPNYDAKKKPYVVFDFDNTSVFLDIEEASLIYQLENLKFKVKPNELDKIIRTGIAEKNFVEDYNNKDDQPVSINTIAPDIVESYTWLYQNYSGLKGKKTLKEVKQSPHYQNFITKMRYLYAAIGDTFDHDVSYPWVTYLFAGFKPEEVSQLAVTTYHQQQKQAIGPVTWTSPESLKGKAGVVSVKWENGLRPYKDVRNLYHTFMKNGFDVYVCSASFIDVIKGVATDKNIGFNVPKQNIYAMELKHDQTGLIIPAFNQDYYQTQGKGKTLTIQKYLVSKYGYGPVFIAGDSEGDQNMMQDFTDTEKVLIVNRWRKSTTDIGKFSKLAVDSYGQANAKYLLQGRDANTGEFIPSNKSLAFGADEAKVFK